MKSPLSMLKYFVFSLMLFNCSILFAQLNDRGNERDFAWEVKQIDEFIDRFNDTDTIYIKTFSKNNELPSELSRKGLLISLFNLEDENLNTDDLNDFIYQVNDPEKPVYLNFFDKDWYAKLICSVTWKGKPEHVTLTMKVKKYPDGSSKWVITGVNADFLKIQRTNDSLANSSLKAIPPANDTTTSLHPYSHATDFMNIGKVSTDKVNIINYFSPPTKPNTDELMTFVNEILNNRLAINSTISLTYYFFQVRGWSFEVRQFNRHSENSGWLISKLIKDPNKLQHNE